MAIGWHFLSEGIGKMKAVHWSAKGYLSGSYGPFSEFFQNMPNYPRFLWFSDHFVMYGLTLAGILLLLGLFTRLGGALGLGLLVMFYVSYPPWQWMPQPGTESNYFLVNKNVIEALGLLAVMAFPTGRFIGFDAVLYPLLAKHCPSWLVGAPSEEA